MNILKEGVFVKNDLTIFLSEVNGLMKSLMQAKQIATRYLMKANKLVKEGTFDEPAIQLKIKQQSVSSSAIKVLRKKQKPFTINYEIDILDENNVDTYKVTGRKAGDYYIGSVRFSLKTI